MSSAGVLIFFAMAGSVSTAMFIVVSQYRDRAAVQGSLREIENMDGEIDVRDAELSTPLADRILLPLRGGAIGLMRRLTPADYIAKIRRQLVLAGKHDDEDVDRFLTIRLMLLCLIPFAFVLSFWVLHYHGTKGWGVVGLLTLVAVLGPSASINRKIAERRAAVQKALPDVLDLLTISVEAGLGFEQSLDRAVDVVPGPLTEELGRMLGEMRAGARRSDALRAFDDRIGTAEVHSFTLAILQADAFGVSITRVLRSQSDEMRIHRRQLAQEKAMKAPVKMLVPMVFCIFPSLFTVVLGPAMLNIMKNFSA